MKSFIACRAVSFAAVLQQPAQRKAARDEAADTFEAARQDFDGSLVRLERAITLARDALCGNVQR